MESASASWGQCREVVPTGWLVTCDLCQGQGSLLERLPGKIRLSLFCHHPYPGPCLTGTRAIQTSTQEARTWGKE